MFGRFSKAFEPVNDGFDADRQRLHSALISFRERVAQLITLIPRDMPGYTVHDVSHLDALWQMAETILGPDYELSPAEVFVLGGAILLHDAGMTVAAFVGGREEIERTVEFSRAFAAIKARASLKSADVAWNEDTMRSAALVEALRVLHPLRARELATQAWKSPVDGKDVFLIEDSELRAHYGATIGAVAQSHHWDHSTLQREFTHPLGPFPSHPDAWAVDPLKIALVLRCADAAHLDARRAPLLLFAANPPHAESAEHWMFQTMLARPVVREGKLLYGSTSDFGINKADAWHLAYDTLKMVDSELSAASEANIHRGFKRFAVDGVLGAGNPEQLAHYIRASGWRPVALNLRVSNVPHLARTLGGKDLYSFDLAPLRELMQNAADAVEARVAIDADFEMSSGLIQVKLSEDGTERILLEVCDNGIGMSERVLTGALLDFGFSFWKSAEAQREFPMLKQDDISPRGRFGIGFFSVFMWADDVEVISRRFNDSPNDTKVLHFRSGLDTRPLLRTADGSEISTKWSTRVKLRIQKPRASEIFVGEKRRMPRLPWVRDRDEPLPRDWPDAVTLLGAALPIRVCVDAFGNTSDASLPQWRTVESSKFIEFFKKIIGVGRGGEGRPSRFAATLSDVKQGEAVIGRAYFVPAGDEVGGLIAVYDKGIFAGRVHSNCARGVLEGRVVNAAREKFEELDIASDSQWVREASEKAFAICDHQGEELGVQETLIRIGARADTRPLFVLNRSVISTVALREYCRSAARLILRLEDDGTGNFTFKKTDSLDVIYGMHVEPSQLYTLINIPGAVSGDAEIGEALRKGASALGKLLQDIASAFGSDCVVHASVIERESYQRDLMVIEFSRE